MSKPYEPLTADAFIAKGTPAPRWAVQGVWPEGASGVIGGAPKNGKSSFGMELAVSLATGTPFLNLREHFSTVIAPVPVLYVQVENSAGRVQRDLSEILVTRGLGQIIEEVVDHHGFLVDPNDPESELIEYDVTEEHFECFNSDALSKLHVLSNAPLALESDEDMAWLTAYIEAHGIRYLFLDPLYMLTSIEYETKSGAIRPLLNFFTSLKEKYGCAVVLTHHQTSKHTSGSAASRLLGDTYIFGWYESALFTSRSGKIFTLEVDAMRELGIESEYTLTGRGVGSWELDPHAQGKTDTLGRKATRSAAKEANVSALGRYLMENPEVTEAELAEHFECTSKTIRRWRADLKDRETVGKVLEEARA